MADNDNVIPPGADLLNDTSINMASDRARRISSLHRTVDDLVQEQNKKRLQVSNEVSSIAKKQQQMRATLELERGEMSSEIAQGYNTVLHGLGRTINSLATGVKNITIDTGKATTDAISQYGRAIGEDISINKTNTMAMALSRATPLFGYFAAKFMETDVFRDSTRRIKDRIGTAMVSGLSKAGDGIANIFKKGKQAVKEDREAHPATVSDLEKLERSIQGHVPKMQEGGYVKTGGMAEVHAAEVVTPIDKLLKQIDEAKSADISKKLDKTLNIMSSNLTRLETVVVQRDEAQRGLVETFILEFQNAKNTKEAAYQERLLKAILELKVGLIGMTSRIRIAWQRTLLQHPMFRNILFFGDLVQTAMLSPIKWLFGIRGGYAGDVRGATRTSNVFLKTANILGMTYTTMMPKLDDIVLYTKAAAEALVGGPVEGATQQGYTMFGQLREMLTTRSLQTFGESSFDKFIDYLGLDRGALGEAGVGGFKDFASPGKIMRNMGATGENIKATIFGESRDKRPEDNMVYRAYTYTKGKAKNVFDFMAGRLDALKRMKENQEEREGPHSPSMAENIASTAKLTDQSYAEQLKEDMRTKKVDEVQLGFFGSMKKNLKKLKNKMWDWIIFGFTFVKDMFFKGLDTLKTFLSPVITMATGFVAAKLGWVLTSLSGILTSIGSFFGIGGAATTATAATTGATTAATAGGMGALGTVAVGAGAIVAGAAGAGMGIWDAVKAIMAGESAEGFVGNWLIRGMSGFLGGTDTGLAGAKHGALKGGLLGAGIGLVGGPIGVLIGGAVGAMAGGILGFLGGKEISKGISETLSVIGDMVKGLYNMMMFPVKIVKESFKMIGVLIEFGWDQTIGRIWDWFTDWLEKPGILQDGINWVAKWMGKIWDWIKKPFIWIGEKIDAIFESDIWDQMGAIIKQMIKGFLFPLTTLSKVYNYLKDEFDKKVSALPIVGPIYKGIKGLITGVHEGTLADSLEESLQDKGYQRKNKGPKPVKVPEETSTPKSSRDTSSGYKALDKVVEEKKQEKKKKSWWKFWEGDEEESKSVASKADAGQKKAMSRRDRARLKRRLPLIQAQAVLQELGIQKATTKRGLLDRVYVNGKWRKATPDEAERAKLIETSVARKLGFINWRHPGEVHVLADTAEDPDNPGYDLKGRKRGNMAKSISAMASTDVIPSEVYGTHNPKEMNAKKSDAVTAKIQAEAKEKAAILEKEMAAAEAFEKVGDKLQSSHRQTTAAVIQNTNILSSSHNSNAVNNGGGGGGSRNFSTGSKVAGDVVACNIE